MLGSLLPSFSFASPPTPFTGEKTKASGRPQSNSIFKAMPRETAILRSGEGRCSLEWGSFKALPIGCSSPSLVLEVALSWPRA